MNDEAIKKWWVHFMISLEKKTKQIIHDGGFGSTKLIERTCARQSGSVSVGTVVRKK